ncbi:hypothetical protein [Couchioplanes caeruleus]|uniref:Uncharacterized protein n=2 Tax=Couchioplanes caeruleus TaxID=56438 RepID=A0A1K0FCT1_9ACTN|nr:hypothetical protein [Couchioplanes caeruleus]OJF10560.1 hypothetical protein BG844_31605 [Couchioplanes caeruleus subsp. caeruleus]
MATVTLAAGLVATPGAAYAADTTTTTTTTLSGVEMAAALKTVATTSTAAAEGGWKATMSAVRGPATISTSYVVDPGRGIVVDQSDFGSGPTTEYAAAGKGKYTYMAFSKNFRAVVRMMGRPTVRHMFQPQPTLKLEDHVEATGPTFAKVLTEDVAYAGTKTVHDNGSADYKYSDDDGTTFTMQVGPAGTLAEVLVGSDGLSVTLTYAYGVPQATLPTAISEKVWDQGMAYLAMRAAVKHVASEAAADTSRTAQGRTVKVAALRKIVRSWATATNNNNRAGLKMIKVKDISRGVRVYATNPWTHETVSYTVKASGRKAVVKSG